MSETLIRSQGSNFPDRALHKPIVYIKDSGRSLGILIRTGRETLILIKLLRFAVTIPKKHHTNCDIQHQNNESKIAAGNTFSGSVYFIKILARPLA